MDPAFPVDEAQLVSLCATSITYGIYLVTLGMTIRALFWGKTGTKERYNWVLISVTGLMFIFATFEVAFGLRHILDAFIFYKGPGGAIAVFEDISNFVNVMKTVNVQVMTLIGDGMLIYRCLVIFSWKWIVVIIPILLWLGNLACGISIILFTATLKKDTLVSGTGTLLNPFLLAFFAITLVTNVLTTGLIVWRIWVLANVMRVVIESGLIYTSLVLVVFGVHLAGNNALYIAADMMVISVGISFNLIIIRIDQGVAYGDTYVETTLPTSIPLKFRAGSSQQPRAMPDMEVVVTRDVDYRDCGNLAKDVPPESAEDDRKKETGWDTIQ